MSINLRDLTKIKNIPLETSYTLLIGCLPRAPEIVTIGKQQIQICIFAESLIHRSVMYVAEITPPSVRGMFTMSTKVKAFLSSFLLSLFFCLQKVGREREAISSLKWLRGNDADVSDEAADIMPLHESVLLVGTFLQLWSLITPGNPASTWGPLILIFAVSATKEGWDDYKRFKRKTFMLVVLFGCARMSKCPVILC